MGCSQKMNERNEKSQSLGLHFQKKYDRNLKKTLGMFKITYF